MTVVVSDTGPLIMLARSTLLLGMRSSFSSVDVPYTVYQEATRDGSKPGAQAVIAASHFSWINVRPDISVPSSLAHAQLDPGETAAIAMAMVHGDTVIIDESRGRLVAKTLGVNLIGSAAVLIKLKADGVIPMVMPLLHQWQTFGYRLSPQLLRTVKARAGE